MLQIKLKHFQFNCHDGIFHFAVVRCVHKRLPNLINLYHHPKKAMKMWL